MEGEWQSQGEQQGSGSDAVILAVAMTVAVLWVAEERLVVCGCVTGVRLT